MSFTEVQSNTLNAFGHLLNDVEGRCVSGVLEIIAPAGGHTNSAMLHMLYALLRRRQDGV